MIVAISNIRRDSDAQPRDHINMDVVREYAEALADGAAFPPVTVFFSGNAYWLADGWHRIMAHEALGLVDIDADVREGDRREAILHSVGANASHGYRRTNADKRRAVMTLVNDDEWSAWSDSEIARRCAVSHPFVGKIRPSLVTVTSEPQARTYTTKHGTVATMKTAAIGSRPRADDDRPVFDATPAGRDERPQPAAPVIQYDHAAAEVRNTAIDAIKALAEGPSPDAVLEAWSKSKGYGIPQATIDAALNWLTDFAAKYPSVEARRCAAVQAMRERNNHVAV